MVEASRKHLIRCSIAALAFVLAACGGSPPAESPSGAGEPGASPPSAASGGEPGDGTSKQRTGSSNEFRITESTTAKSAHGVAASKIQPTETEAALKFFVVDKDKGPVEGIVISLTGPGGKKYYTEETDAAGYAEVLVPAGAKYELVYLSLGRKNVAARVAVEDAPRLTLKLTLRYKGYVPRRPGRPAKPGAPAEAPSPRFVLKGVHFDTGKATIRPESFARLDRVVEFMTHKKSSRIEISGHTDDVGKKKANKALSNARAEACRDYLVSKGVDPSRIEAVGYGDERPIAPNDTEEGRQKNRRIEVREL